MTPAACFVREPMHSRAAFGGRPDYLASAGGLAAGEPWPSDFGVELSRGFRALKIWWTIKEQGLDRLGAGDRAQLRGRRNIWRRGSRANANIEIAAPVAAQHRLLPLYRTGPRRGGARRGSTPRSWSRSRRAGSPPPRRRGSNGRLCIRICITNHRSRNEDFDLIAEAIAETGARLSGCGVGGKP